MRVMVLVKATAESEAGEMPSEEMFAAMTSFNEQLVDAGIMVSGDGLKPSSYGARIRFDGDGRTVTPGPFAATNELVAGFWIWEVASMDEAIEWAKRCPNPMPGPSDLEIRPFYTAEDFAEMLSPELRAREERLAERLGE